MKERIPAPITLATVSMHGWNGPALRTTRHGLRVSIRPRTVNALRLCAVGITWRSAVTTALRENLGGWPPWPEGLDARSG